MSEIDNLLQSELARYVYRAVANNERRYARALPNPWDGDSILQEVLVALIENEGHSEFLRMVRNGLTEADRSVVKELVKSCLNRATNAVDKRKQRRSGVTYSIEEQPQIILSDDCEEAIDLRIDLAKAMTQLSAEEQTVIRLKNAGLSDQEIWSQLQVSKATFHRILSAARRKLSAVLYKHDNQP